jgi:DNA primase
MVSAEDYLLLMFSMKGMGKRVDLKHVQEKLSRDLKKVSQEEIKNILDSMIKKGFLEEVKGLYGITKRGKEFFSQRLKEVEEELRKVNNAWVIVYKAKQYYPVVANTVFEFCKDRYVGYYCLFTEKRFFRRDFRGKKIVLKSVKDLLFFINIHCIDVIPCVHRIGMNRPDWLVVDIDPGEKVSFGQTKEVAEVTYKIFEKLNLNPAIKFSGSRGFQIWSLIKDFEMPEEYQPLVLKGKSKREKNYFTLFSDFVRVIQKEVDKEIPKLTTSEALGKEERMDKILLDSASMKPMGLVRAPYAVHSKSGLVSMPISIKELKNFVPEYATTERVIERYEKKGNEFLLKPSSPEKLLSLFK